MSQYNDVNEKLVTYLSATAMGNERAFESLYRLSSPKLQAIIFGIIGDEALAHDILQQAYVAIWKNAHKFDANKGKPFTWMLVIARHKALDMIRQRKKFALSEEICETLPDESMQSDLGANGFLLRRIIAPHMASLSANMRDAIILNVVHGMSSREIGEKFSVPTNTAKSWIRRGLEKLQADIDIDDVGALL